ncbi:hypothetical protein [Terrimonas pollutisoli]|uniref:hypothetical protein n=1 Tax=Terrimonas pollutisoli TaxID=3034147 RepID=UPI0023EB7151|nr:hypothetical protein [Terrimonas sp. H1YJ31]
MQKCFVLLLTAFASILFQQVNAQDSTLTQKMTNNFCVEFSKKDFTKFKGAEMEIGLLIMPIIEKYSKEIEKEWGLSTQNEEDYEKISRKIGQESARGCPKFVEFIKNNLSEIKDSEEEEEEIKSVSGVFQRIENNLFSILVVKTKTGKEEKLWWFQFFDGSDLLIENPAAFNRKNITVKYTEMEVYDPKLKDYRPIKVIQSLKTN